MLDIYLSSVSNKMNETMKVLTIFSSIFIPLTFIAGVYGMNFEHMPELQWKWGYPTLWVVFIAISAFLLRFFKKKDWL
jgi:magnesium transporter